MHCRLAAPADAPRLAEIYAPYVANTAVTFATVPLTEADFLHKMQGPYPFLVCEENGAVQGYAYAAAFREKEAYRWGVELTIYLSPEAQGKGAGTLLMDKLLALLRLQGYQTAYSCITLPNPGSIALHKKLGFEQIGLFARSGYKLGQWHDVVWLALSLGEYETSPREPIPLSQLDQAQIMAILER